MVRSSALDRDPALQGHQRMPAIACRVGAMHYLNTPGGANCTKAARSGGKGITLDFLQQARASLLEPLCSETPKSIQAEVC